MARLAQMISAGMRVARRRLTGCQAPMEINIHITDRCNLKCTYCYSNFYKRRNPPIPTAKVLEIVDAFAAMGVVEVSLIGGEPLLHPDFDRIVAHVKARGLFCSAVTNGYFLKSHLDAVRRLDMVCVSIDGPEAVNDVTRGAGSFRAAIGALELLAAHGVNRSVRMTLQRHNLDQIEAMTALCRAHDAMLNFGLLFPQSSADGTVKVISDETPADAAYRSALARIVALKRCHPRWFFNSLKNLENALNWPTSFTRFFLFDDELRGEFPDFKPVPCYGGRTFATVDTDGRLYPCTNLIGYYDAPSVLTGDIRGAWRQLAGHGCRACFYLSSVEKNLVSHLDPQAILNLIRVRRLR